MSNVSITESELGKYYVNLNKYLPDSIYNCPQTNEILTAQSYQIAIINYYIQDLINNCFISTATWGLDILEQEYGIQTNDPSLSIESRRSTLLSYRRGYGVINEAKIISIADAYNCDCEIIPHWSESYFVIKFTGLGVPSNLDAFKTIVEQIKPAHLGVEYQFTYELWNEVKNFSWDDVSKYTWEEVLTEPLQTKINLLYTLSADGTTYSKIEFEEETVLDTSQYTLYSQDTNSYGEMQFITN